MSNNVIRITDKLNISDSNIIASSKCTSELKDIIDALDNNSIREDTLTAAQQATASGSGGEAGGVTLEGVAAEVASLGGEVASLSGEVASLSAEVASLGSGKADIDASNFSVEGKALLAGLGMPKEGSIELTFGASGSTYSVDDADGWLFAFVNTTNSAGAKLDMYYTGGSAGISTMRNNAGIIRAFLPLRKGNACSIAYANASEKHLYFVPVVGAE